MEIIWKNLIMQNMYLMHKIVINNECPNKNKVDYAGLPKLLFLFKIMNNWLQLGQNNLHSEVYISFNYV